MDAKREFEGHWQQGSESSQAERSQTRSGESTEPLVSNEWPECQDGVCVVVWKPRKPQAA
jgi:hypothetical protein